MSFVRLMTSLLVVITSPVWIIPAWLAYFIVNRKHRNIVNIITGEVWFWE